MKAHDRTGSSEDTLVSIPDAYAHLSHEAFAVWVRLMVASDEQLAAGRHRVAEMLDYSECRSNAVLRELKHKRYVRLVKSGEIGKPTRVELIKFALISGPNNFVRLAPKPTFRGQKVQQAQ